jgi:hypothetical protein
MCEYICAHENDSLIEFLADCCVAVVLCSQPFEELALLPGLLFLAGGGFGSSSTGLKLQSGGGAIIIGRGSSTDCFGLGTFLGLGICTANCPGKLAGPGFGPAEVTVT